MNANDWNYNFQKASNGQCTFKVIQPEIGNIKNTDELILKMAEINLKYALELAKREIVFCEKWLSYYEEEMKTDPFPYISRIMCEYYSSEIQKFKRVFIVRVRL